MALPIDNIDSIMVRDCLGELSDNICVLCLSEKINMWSRFKPTRAPENNEKILNNNTFWKGADERCGFVLPVLSGGAWSLSNWGYDKPRGTADEPYRLDDFRGYEHDANVTLPPFYSIGNNVPSNLDPVETNIMS